MLIFHNILEELKDKKRTGRPPTDVSKDIMVKIRQELSDSNNEWDFRQVMNLIYKKNEVRYHEVHIYRLLHYRLLHKWGFKSKVPHNDCTLLLLKKRRINSKKNKTDSCESKIGLEHNCIV